MSQKTPFQFTTNNSNNASGTNANPFGSFAKSQTIQFGSGNAFAAFGDAQKPASTNALSNVSTSGTALGGFSGLGNQVGSSSGSSATSLGNFGFAGVGASNSQNTPNFGGSSISNPGTTSGIGINNSGTGGFAGFSTGNAQNTNSITGMNNPGTGGFGGFSLGNSQGANLQPSGASATNVIKPGAGGFTGVTAGSNQGSSGVIQSTGSGSNQTNAGFTGFANANNTNPSLSSTAGTGGFSGFSLGTSQSATSSTGVAIGGFPSFGAAKTQGTGDSAANTNTTTSGFGGLGLQSFDLKNTTQKNPEATNPSSSKNNFSFGSVPSDQAAQILKLPSEPFPTTQQSAKEPQSDENLQKSTQPISFPSTTTTGPINFDTTKASKSSNPIANSTAPTQKSDSFANIFSTTAKTSTATTTSTPTTSTAAATTTTSSNVFNFPTTTPTITTSSTTTIPTTTATATATAALSVLKPSAEYSNLDIKGIIQQWYKELAEDAIEFEKQAQRVRVWDEQLAQNQTILEETVDNVRHIISSQNELKVACESIEAYQNDLESDLQKISMSLDFELENFRNEQPTEDDYEREKMYRLADELNMKLDQMENNLKSVNTDFRTTTASATHPTGNREDTIGKIMAILNAQYESLSRLDEKSSNLKQEIVTIKNELNGFPL